MPQNKYDRPILHPVQRDGTLSRRPPAAAYSRVPGDIPAGRPRVLDLGCGFGWHCRFARERGATGVVGIDLSGECSNAQADTADPISVPARGDRGGAFPPARSM
jgi:SAM-dependent methyltransferase